MSGENDRNTKRWVVNLMVLLGALALSLGIGELALRWHDHYPLFGAMPDESLEPKDIDRKAQAFVDEIQVPADVRKEWFNVEPPFHQYPDLPPEEKKLLLDDLGDGPSLSIDVELVKRWNLNFLTHNICVDPNSIFIEYFSRFPGFVYAFKPNNRSHRPTYRFFFNGYVPGLPSGYNNYGWRGLPIPLNKPDSTIRIAFIGASTTQQANIFRYSYPEYVVSWLNLWAKSRGHDFTFECINAGREAFGIDDIAATVKYELLPVRPDIFIFYEGINQFGFVDILEEEYTREFGRAQLPMISRLVERSNLVRKLIFLQGGKIGEPAKPYYKLKWPTGLDRENPDISHPKLPSQLVSVLSNLDSMRVDIEGINSELILSSFVMMVKDGMKLNPATHKYIYGFWNAGYYPITYKDIRMYSDFQNRVLEKFAEKHGLAFLDVSQHMPFEPDLFNDGVHMYNPGVKLRAWITFLELLPIIRNKIESGELPRSSGVTLETHPELDNSPVYKVQLQCSCPERHSDKDPYCLNHFIESLTW